MICLDVILYMSDFIDWDADTQIIQNIITYLLTSNMKKKVLVLYKKKFVKMIMISQFWKEINHISLIDMVDYIYNNQSQLFICQKRTKEYILDYIITSNSTLSHYVLKYHKREFINLAIELNYWRVLKYLELSAENPYHTNPMYDTCDWICMKKFELEMNDDYFKNFEELINIQDLSGNQNRRNRKLIRYMLLYLINTDIRSTLLKNDIFINLVIETNYLSVLKYLTKKEQTYNLCRNIIKHIPHAYKYIQDKELGKKILHDIIISSCISHTNDNTIIKISPRIDYQSGRKLLGRFCINREGRYWSKGGYFRHLYGNWKKPTLYIKTTNKKGAITYVNIKYIFKSHHHYIFQHI